MLFYFAINKIKKAPRSENPQLFRLLRCTYLWPLGIKLTSFLSIFQSCLVLAQFEKSRWTVTVQDAVLWVDLQCITVQMNGCLKVTSLTRLIALLHFLHELSFAQTVPGPVVSNAPDRSARCPRTEDWKLEKRTGSSQRALISLTEKKPHNT